MNVTLVHEQLALSASLEAMETDGVTGLVAFTTVGELVPEHWREETDTV